MKKTIKKNDKKQLKQVNQLTIARDIYKKLGYEITLENIQKIIQLEQDTNVEYLKKGFKVCKKNYLTLTPVICKKRQWTSPLDNKVYDIPDRINVSVKIGEGLRQIVNSYVAEKPTPQKVKSGERVKVGGLEGKKRPTEPRECAVQ